MKKNFGNAVVRKVITVAMATMLVATSPAMNSIAADEEHFPSTEEVVNGVVDTIEGTDILNQEQKDFLTDMTTDLSKTDYTQEPIDVVNDTKEVVGNNVVDAIDKTETLSQAQKDLLTDITVDLKDTDLTQNTVDIIDSTTGSIGNNVEAAIGEQIDNVEAAVSRAEQTTTNATDLDATIEGYETVTDTLLNNDKELVASVGGNTDSEGNQIVETITSNGDILINVTDEEGNTTEVKVDEYTQTKADEATAAAGDALAALDSFLAAPSADNAQEQREKINAAIEVAEAAKNDAETAYNAAESVLLEEIKQYNAYAAKYGYELYTYKGTTPTYTAEELANMPELDSLDKDKNAISNEVTDINATVMDEQLTEIKAAAELVTSCDVVVEQAKGAIHLIETTEDNILNFLNKVKNDASAKIEETEKELAAATSESERKKLQERLDHYQRAYNDAKDVLHVYTEHQLATEVSATTGTEVTTIQDRFDYAVDSAKTLANDIDTMVDDANAKLADSAMRYEEAKAKYNELKKEYENYLAQNTIDANFESLKNKLAAAEVAVESAKEDLDVAIEAVNTAKEIKINFDKEVANIPAGGSGDSGSSNNTTSSGSTTTIVDSATPLVATISDEQVPLTDTIAIDEEAAPLADSVPKTGDASAAAGAVGASGLVSMLGALFLNLKKRTLR